jgi:ribosomal protein S18 acetylase RimI-like enzyme
VSATAQAQVRPLAAADRAWADGLIAGRWGSLRMVTRGVLHDMTHLPGLVAWRAGERVGLLTYCLAGDSCEIVSLDSLVEGAGIGSALVAAAQATARSAGCRRLWLITTNDNLPALRFYQRRGFRLVAVHVGAVDEARRLKPEIPAVGLDGMALHDELELEFAL